MSAPRTIQVDLESPLSLLTPKNEASPLAPLEFADVGPSAREHGWMDLFDVLDRFTKRAIDIITALVLLALATPAILIVTILVVIDGGPTLYSHARVGAGLRPFRCHKFRTMILGSDTLLDEYLAYHPDAASEWRNEQKLSFDPRVTPIGRLLRKTSFDELPQLFNVLKGEMSLVGPRPVTSSELVRYGDAAVLYAKVRPGITGLWQVSGRNEVSYAERVSLDGHYARRRNLLMDLIILLSTPAAVLSQRGAR